MRMIECGLVGIDVSVCFHLYHFFFINEQHIFIVIVHC